jgi:hypothetical protein
VRGFELASTFLGFEIPGQALLFRQQNFMLLPSKAWAISTKFRAPGKIGSNDFPAFWLKMTALQNDSLGQLEISEKFVKLLKKASLHVIMRSFGWRPLA